MAHLVATTDSFLQSSAQLLILPMSRDGVVTHPLITRTMLLYPSFYSLYRHKAMMGEWALSDTWVHKVQQEVTGLGVGSNRKATHIAALITHTHAHHSAVPSTLKQTISALNPQLYQLMRYQNLRHAAFLVAPLLADSSELDSNTLWRIGCDTFDVPRMRIELHFAKDMDMSFVSNQPL